QQYNLLHYNNTQGLISNKCYNITQDSEGYLWMATESGASRFDGSHFTTYTAKKDGLGDNENLEVFADSNNRVWFSGFNRTLCYYALADKKVYGKYNHPLLAQINSMLPQAGILRSFYEDQHKRLWILHEQTAARCIGNNNMLLYTGSKENITSVFETGAGGVQLADVAGNIYTPVNNGLVQKTRLSSKPHRIKQLLVYNGQLLVLDSSGKLFVYHETGPYRYTLLTQIALPGANKLFTGNLRFPGIWVTTLCNGVLWYRTLNDVPMNRPAAHLLPGKCIRNIFFDREENAWFISYAEGIYALFNQYNRYLFTPQPANAVLEHNGVLWYGTYQGALVQWQNGRVEKEVRTETQNAVQNRVTCMLYNEHDNRLWLGTDIGLFCRNTQNQLTRVQTSNPTRQHNITTIKILAKDAANRLWAGTCCGLYPINEQQNIALPPVTKKRITALCGARDGRVWFASRDTLFVLENNQVRPARWQPPKDVAISALAETPNNMLWVGTYGAGIKILYREEQVGNLQEDAPFPQQLTSNLCRKIIVGNDNNTVWVATNKGLNRVQYTTTNPVAYTIQAITRSNGLNNEDINDFCISANQLFIATSDGINIFPQNITDTVPAPLAQIENMALLISPDSLLPNNARLQHRQNSIQFRYAAVSMRSQGDVLYEVLLEGYDTYWQPAPQRNARYTSLPPGHYRFLVRARNKHGHWGTPSAPFVFSIQPALHQTWWFRTGMVLAAVFVLVLLFLLLRKQSLRKARISRRISELQLEALRAQMNPHFIYNCLNSIQYFLSENNSTQAKFYLARFARLVRQTLDYSARRFISLAEEITYMENYMLLEKMRFEDKLHYTIETTGVPEPEQVMLPPLLLQPYAENALRHGIAPLKNRQGIITITYERENGVLLCTVDDNGVGRIPGATQKETAQTHGMHISLNRVAGLNAILKQHIKTEITDKSITGNGTGTRVRLTIPLNPIHSLYETH
ncbi:MAG: histidine kinase, partial [Dinghuibacter sp.]|nr:histidine kinase [Dinghuibacter sp.]